MKLYHYSKCSTCRKAIKYLESKGLTYEEIDIVENPPSQAELKRMLGHLDGGRLVGWQEGARAKAIAPPA